MALVLSQVEGSLPFVCSCEILKILCCYLGCLVSQRTGDRILCMGFCLEEELECWKIGAHLQSMSWKSSALKFFDFDYRTFVPKTENKYNPFLL